MPDDNVDSKVAVLLMGVGSAALMVSIYHCIAMGWCNRDRAGSTQQNSQRFGTNVMAAQSSMENSTAQLIPAFKYQKGMRLVVSDDEETCAICLSEFEEGEELRTLLECLHTYHALCIDMWLYSHNTCPMCRTNATPSPRLSIQSANMELEGSEQYRNSGVLQNVVIDTRVRLQ